MNTRSYVSTTAAEMEEPRNRTTNVSRSMFCMTLLFSFLALVLAMVAVALPIISLLSAGNPYKLSYLYTYIWEIIMCSIAMLTSVVCLILCYCTWRSGNETIFKPVSVDRDIFFLFIMWILGGISTYLAFSSANRAHTCVDSNIEPNFYNRKFEFQVCRGISIIIACITITLLQWKKYRCSHAIAKSLIILSCAYTVSLLVNAIVDVFRANNTHSFVDRDLGNGSAAYDFFHQQPVFSYCNGTIEIIDASAADEYDILYPSNALYCVISLCFLYQIGNFSTISNIDDHSDTLTSGIEDTSTEQTTTTAEPTTRTGYSTSIEQTHKVLKVVCSLRGFCLKYSSYGSCLFAFAYLCCRIFLFYFGGPNHAIYYITAAYHDCMLLASGWGCVKVPKDFKILRKRGLWHNVFLCFASLFFFFVLFEAIDALNILFHGSSDIKVGFFIQTILIMMGIFCQVCFILFMETSDFELDEDKDQLLKALAKFLFFTNLLNSSTDLIFRSTVITFIADIESDDMFGSSNWHIIVYLLFPAATGFRLFSVDFLFRVSYKQQTLKELLSDIKDSICGCKCWCCKPPNSDEHTPFNRAS